MSIKNMFIYHFVDPGVEKIFEKRGAAEKGDINF